MPDREKVIRIIDELIFEAQKEPNWKAESALKCLKKELLKKQEAVVGELKPQKIRLEERKVLADDSYDEPVYSIDKFFHCPRCNKILSRTYEKFDIRFCSNCGQAVQWD